MNYREAIEYLYSVRLFGTKLGLANTEHLLRELGHPENGFLTIHVAGTNGKGSVCAMLSSILSAAGYKVGLFTSPHILSFRERIGVGEELISEEEICHHLAKLLPIMEGMQADPVLSHPTFFEIVTVLAVDYFAARKVDIAVMETGMGGRLDATNALPSRIQVITTIGLEHTGYLGNSIEEIAREKAGIIKEGATVVVGEEDETALGVIRAVAAEKHARILRFGEHVRFLNRRVKFPVQRLHVLTPQKRYDNVALPLLGQHQAVNCCLTVAAVEEVERCGFAIASDSIRRGIRGTRWPGRFEVIPGSPNCILDAACNPHACKALAQTLEEVVKASPLALIFGVLRDKDYKRMCEILFPLADNIILTQPRSQRALSVQELRDAVASIPSDNPIHAFVDVAEAIAYASELSPLSESFVCIAGSNYLLGPARKALGLDDLPEDFVLSESFDGDTKRSSGGAQ